jgi:tRNA pseudouridine55 synthase
VTSGLLLVDKPSGPTSHDVVAIIRRGTGQKRVGHAGTLDPLATGLLVVCLGSATRLSEYLLGKPKQYRARVRLGQTTNTYDAQGEFVSESPLLPTRERVEAALAGFRGPIQQRPPAFSAIKRAGQKSYELARRGEAVDLAPRPVEIMELALTDWQPPECELTVTCSAGTYMRSLAHDLGQTLGCGAHLAALRRTASGAFSLAQAVALNEVRAEFDSGAWLRRLLPPEAAIAELPVVRLSAAEAARVGHGGPVPCAGSAGDLARAYNPAGELVALLRADLAAGVWRPHKVFAE